ncbi:MAG: hypothetical protein RRC34_16590 [Lentisphaeria bacterium]|nr:hypothetical protein [Lentisphaeria bacterium]
MALIDPAFDAFFARTVRALSPYLDQFVIIGGCANALYRHIPGANPGLIPLGTYEVAFMFRGDLPEFCCQLRDTKSLWQGKRLPKAIEVLKEQFAHERSEGVLQVVDVGTDSSQEILPAAVLRATGRLVTALEVLQKGKS